MTEFQPAVLAWMLDCFGEDVTCDKRERAIRFLEEAIELTQACGMTQYQPHALVKYVYNR